MNITLVFSSSKAAEAAFLQYFQDSGDYIAQFNRQAATIAIDCGGAPIAEGASKMTGEGTHLEIPDGLIGIII